MSDKVLVLHHDDADGFCAAWVAATYLGRDAVELVAVDYGKPTPDVRDRDVLILDFSYPRAELDRIRLAARGVLLLDHHKSAAEDLRGVDCCYFDMGQSGAQIALDFFSSGASGLEMEVFKARLMAGDFAAFSPRVAVDYERAKRMARVVELVGDADLNRYELDNSLVLNNVIATLPRTLHAWDSLADELHDDLPELVGDGIVIQQYKDMVADEVRGKTTLKARIGGHLVPLYNTAVLRTDVVQVAAEPGVPFVAYFFAKAGGGVEFGLRALDPDFDVSEVARRYGGGGHKGAAGFRVRTLLIGGPTLEVLPDGRR